MCAFALGSLGLKPWEFYEYSFEEYSLACKGYRDKSVADWDRTRHIMYAVLKGAGAKKLNSVSDVLELPGDNEAPEVSTEERNRMQEKMRRKRYENLIKAHTEHYGRQQT